MQKQDTERGFRNDSAALLTKALFLEVSNHPDMVLYSLEKGKTKDGKELSCIQDLYVQEMDVSEYKFACKYFQDYGHWCRVKNAPWFEGPYERMTAALYAKLRAQALDAMLEQVYEGKASHQTLKYLANGEFKPATKVGRPNKKAVQKMTDDAVKKKTEEQIELERLIEHDPKLAKMMKGK